MLDPVLQTFLTGRLKSSSNPTLPELEKELDDWLPKAAKKAGKLFRVSHPVKFSHPDAKNTSEVCASALHRNDGFLRTGNSDTDLDTIFDTSANIPIWKFLALRMADGKSVLEHLQQNTEAIKQQLTIPSMDYSDIRTGLLAITELSGTIKTSEKIKQVYFPIEGGYHLLSILTPSGLVFKLKERINAMRFSEQAKQARDDRRNQAHNEHGCDEIYNLAAIGFGGTKPQNISILNNQNGGIAYLLPSLPPVLAQRVVRRPKSSFFKDSLYFKPYREEFLALHRLFMAKPNNIDIRDGRDDWIISIAERVLETVGQLRQETAGWSENTRLPLAQKIWLDSAFDVRREQEDEWLAEIIVSLADWFRIAYRNVIGAEKAIAMGDDELKHIRKVLGEHEELLR
ncbi:type I-F CRISPR-associated protein Csy1 [Methylomicrobium agile]|uniref:type I-F CRISPR-associated protein Csy1 n=1 Tax=Methylomicrobium agile TaxID=39774 RepID=UPI0004DF0B0A|nr:type I-F CRISPR-associated protein Csy1 [Methylomicrobium agile]